MKLPKVSIIVLVSILALVFLGPLFLSVSPYELNAKALLQPPSTAHWLGTDRLGRDMFARLLYGGQVSILIGVGSALIATLIGLIVGVTAGFFQGTSDKLFVIIVDLFLTFPTFFLLLTLLSYMQASIWVLIVVISITGWMTTARLIRSESFAITSKPFIKILRIAKVNKFKILFKYYLPMLLPIFLIAFTFGVSGAILAESGLSFLGLGIMPPQMSWGLLLSEGQQVLDVAWWISLFPGLLIFIVTFNLINISDYLQYKSDNKGHQIV